MTTFFITGNLGYIGTVLAPYIKSQSPSSTIIGYDLGLFSISPLCLSSDHSVDIQYYGDVRDTTLLDSIFTNHHIDFVVHLAALSNDPMGNEFSELTNDINFLSTCRLADLASHSSVSSFVFASSCSVYGKGSDFPRCETDEMDPLTAYAKSKVNSENYLHSISSETNTCFTSLRFATACGYSPMYRLDLVLNEFIYDAFLTSTVNILSDGMPWRPLIDVLDMCKLLFWACVRESVTSYEVFNAGANQYNYQVKDIALAVNSFFNNSIDVSINPTARSDNRSYKVNFTKLDSIVDPIFKPSVNLASSINRVVSNLGDSMKNVSSSGNAPSLRRLVTLRNLLSSGIIDKSLSWVGHSVIL